MDETREGAFKRSPAYAFWSIVWAFVLVAIGLSDLSGGALRLLVYLGPAALFLINAWWCWRVPYVRSDGDGLTAYPAIVCPPRTVAWSDVKHLRSKGNGRLYLLRRDNTGISIRLRTIAMEQRPALVDEILSRSGRRLLPMTPKASSRRLLPTTRKPR
jgi:hypothetical protein